MTRYLLPPSSTDLPTHVLYVRRWSEKWVVCYLPVDPKYRQYPNYDFDTGRLYWHPELPPCHCREAMLNTLDHFAKRYGLEKETEYRRLEL